MYVIIYCSLAKSGRLICIARSLKFCFVMVTSVRAKRFTGSSGKTSLDLSNCFFKDRLLSLQKMFNMQSTLLGNYRWLWLPASFLCNFLCETTLLLFRVSVFRLSQLPHCNLLLVCYRSSTAGSTGSTNFHHDGGYKRPCINGTYKHQKFNSWL